MPFPGATIRKAMSDSSFFCSAVSAGYWCVMVAVAASGRGLSHAPAGCPPQPPRTPILRGPGTPVGLSPPALPISGGGGGTLHKQAASRQLPLPRDGQGLV